jgi:tripartite-type tricarboxylate transporter receptor subunit TctC
MLGGELDLTATSLGGATPFLQAGQLRALAAMSSRRPVSLPNLPTVAEFGYPEFDLLPWMGVFVRAGTPAQIVQRLETELIKAVTHPDVKILLNKVGVEPAPLGSKNFGELLKRDIATWAKVIKDVIPALSDSDSPGSAKSPAR